MPRIKWVMLCPMARSGSSHTSELLAAHEGMGSHHGLFNNGPMGRWPSKNYIAPEMRDYYSAVLDENHKRVGGQEHSGEFLERYIFTDDERFNPRQWQCIGFKLQYAHFVYMPDLRDYLVRNRDIKIILNTRRDLLEHTAAETWCQQGNSRAHRENSTYERGNTENVAVPPMKLLATFRNLCRYREDAITTFDTEDRCFLEWSLEDMFDRDGNVDAESHRRLFDFLEMAPSRPFASSFAKTPRPGARAYITNLDELRELARSSEDGAFEKYFREDYDPYSDRSWPRLTDYRLDSVMVVKDNAAFRS